MKLNFVVLALLLVSAGTPQQRQISSSLTGIWNWEEHRRGTLPQLAFLIEVKVAGSRVWGTYSMATAISGEWQVDDGNQTPFEGKLTNGIARVEFDPENIQPGYVENVKYVKPNSGRPSVATIRRTADGVQWRLESGPRVGSTEDDNGQFPLTMILKKSAPKRS